MAVKFEFALKAMDPHVRMKDLCAEYGISKPIGHKWRNRFIQEGLAGLNELRIPANPATHSGFILPPEPLRSTSLFIQSQVAGLSQEFRCIFLR